MLTLTPVQKVRLLLTLMALATVVAVFSPLRVFAEDAAPVPGADTAAFVISAPIVMIILGTVVPILTGILTKATLSPGIKGLITLLLNAVAAGLTTAITVDGSAIFSNQTALTWLLGVIASTAAYYNVWRPFNITSSPGGKLGPTTGIGPSV